MSASESSAITYIASYRTPRKNNVNVFTCDLDTFARRLDDGGGSESGMHTLTPLSRKARAALDSPYLNEILLGNPYVKPYYDWDCIVDTEAAIATYRESELDALEGALERLHPDAEIVLAERSGYNAGKKIWKISLRAFVQNIKMKVGDIATHITTVLGDDKPEQLDTKVYKLSEQLLGCIRCRKTPDDNRVLMPLDEQPVSAYIVQDIRDCEVLEVVGGASAKRGLTESVPPATVSTVSGGLASWLASVFRIEESLIRMRKPPQRNSFIIETRSKRCPFYVNGEHTSNHVYVLVKLHKSIELRCHDKDTCDGRSTVVDWKTVPQGVRNELLANDAPPRAGVKSTADMIDGVIANGIATSGLVSTGVAPGNVPEAQLALSNGINTALRCSDKDWTWEKYESKDKKPKDVVNCTTYRRRLVPGCVECLHDPEHVHYFSEQCTLKFSETTMQQRTVSINCINVPKPMDVTPRYPQLYEVHHTYNAHLQVSATFDVNVRKVKDQDFELCWNVLVERAQAEGLLRGDSEVYVSIDNKPCCYTPRETFEYFIQTNLDETPEYVNSARAHDQLMGKIQKHGDKRFPLLRHRVNRSWIGVANGLICLGDVKTRVRPKFIPFEDVTPEICDKIIVRQYIDQYLSPTGGTPAFDTIVKHQLPEDEIVCYFKAFLGRLMYPVKSDEHQVTLMIKGVARTGKSTVIEALKDIVGLADIASFSGEGEKVFGIGGAKLEKSLIIIDDLPTDTQKMLTGTEFQAMTTGGIVDGKSKHKDARTVAWKIPFCIATNVWPNWPDNDGSLVRRLVTFFFETPLENADTRLAEQIIHRELSNILWSCVNAYFDRLIENPPFAHGKQFYDACPEYFNIGRTKHINSLDKINGFFHATPDQLREVLREDSLGNHAEWIQYEVEIRHNPVGGKKKYGSPWGLVQEAFQVYKKNLRLRNELAAENGCWKRNKLEVVDRAHYYDYGGNRRSAARHVLGLFVSKSSHRI